MHLCHIDSSMVLVVGLDLVANYHKREELSSHHLIAQQFLPPFSGALGGFAAVLVSSTRS